MVKGRRRYSQEFKIEAVKQVVEQGRSVSDVADSLGVNRNMLSSWKTKLAAEGVVKLPDQTLPTEVDKDEEIRRLRRELAIARQERDILKKATAYFANDKS